MGLTDKGQLFSWGENACGQLGQGTAESVSRMKPRCVCGVCVCVCASECVLVANALNMRSYTQEPIHTQPFIFLLTRLSHPSSSALSIGR